MFLGIRRDYHVSFFAESKTEAATQDDNDVPQQSLSFYHRPAMRIFEGIYRQNKIDDPQCHM